MIEDPKTTPTPGPPRRDLDDIQAVLVLYRRPLGETETFQSLDRALAFCGGTLDLFVYDNSPTPAPLPEGSMRWRFTHEHDSANSGVSRAFNRGADLARERGKKWLLLLDQDTVFPQDALTAYRTAIAEQPAMALFAPRLVGGERLYSPCGYRAGIGYFLSRVDPGEFSLRNRALLNSGLLVSVAAFFAAGGYDERVRLDYADFVFLNRIRGRLKHAWILGLTCRHGFSDLEVLDAQSALQRFRGFCRDGRAAAVTPRLVVTHGFLAVRRCLHLICRYRSVRFLAPLISYFRRAGQ